MNLPPQSRGLRPKRDWECRVVHDPGNRRHAWSTRSRCLCPLVAFHPRAGGVSSPSAAR